MKNRIKIDKLHSRLTTIYNELIDAGFETGVQTAIYYEGEMIADVNCGTISSTSKKKVTSETLFPVCSTSKGVGTALVNTLAEKRAIFIDEPIANYWPQYGVKGKNQTTLIQAISHQAGIPQRAAFHSFEEICNWEKACNKIADLTPKWTPGTNAEYHAFNWGWIIGGTLERATGKSYNELLKEYVTVPLGIDREIFFGTDEEAETRVSKFELQPTAQEQCSTGKLDLGEVPGPLSDFVNRPDVMRACMPAVNGIMSACAIAKLYAAMIGEVDGVRLFSDETLKKATTLQTKEGSMPACFGHGMGLGFPLKGPKNNKGAFFGHGGAGGSEGLAIAPLKLAIGFTKNRFDTHVNAKTHTWWMMVNEIFDVFGREYDGGFYS